MEEEEGLPRLAQPYLITQCSRTKKVYHGDPKKPGVEINLSFLIFHTETCKKAVGKFSSSLNVVLTFEEYPKKKKTFGGGAKFGMVNAVD